MHFILLVHGITFTVFLSVLLYIVEMGKLIGPPLCEADQSWILQQHIFFHATAPLSTSHRVNVSPKSAKEFRILDSATVAWADLTGSGSETCAHILQNGRLTVMFVALNGPPKIIRLHGRGRIILRADLNKPENSSILGIFASYIQDEPEECIGLRAIVVLDIERASQSCGYSIPFYDYRSERSTLCDVTKKKGLDGILLYRQLKNSYSIDGLRSIAQLEMAHTNTAPVKVDSSDGYVYVSEYGSSLASQCWVNWNLYFQFTSWGISNRDCVMLAVGLGVGVLTVHVGRSLPSFDNSLLKYLHMSKSNK